MSPPLRLRAADADDLGVIAACLQDALIPLSEMAYLADERRFMAAFTRFQRERSDDPTPSLTQCQSALVLREIEAARFRGLDSRFGAVKLELLTLFSEPAAGGLTRITLLFAGDAAIQLDARGVAATLEDFGEPWPAAVTPSHPAAVRPGRG